MATERTEPAFVASAASVEQPEEARAAGLGPGRLALRRLRRNRVALAFGAIFLVVVALCLAAPIWANHFAHTTPLKNNLTGQVRSTARRRTWSPPTAFRSARPGSRATSWGQTATGATRWSGCSTADGTRC